MRLNFHFPLRAALAASLILVLLPSAWSATKKAKPMPLDITKMVWPPPPDAPRIKFLGQYSGEIDLVGQKRLKGGMLERLAGVNILPEERPKMSKPYGVVVDSKGRVFVADWAQKVVFVFNLEGKKLDFRGDRAPANLLSPVGVAVDERDRLFVSDSRLHQITCFDTEGNVESVFGEKELNRPAGMAVDNPLHRLYVADAGGKRIAVFNLETFKLISYIGESTSKERIARLTNPNSIAIDADGLIYVTDAIAARVVSYDTDGNFVRTWGKRGDGPGMFGRPKGIAIDADGHVYVADAQQNRVQVFSPEGKPLIAFGGGGYRAGQFALMTGLAIDSQNRVIAVDQLPARIEVFRYITDAEASAAKSGVKVPELGQTAGPVAAPPVPNHAAPPATSQGPTIEELQKQLAELKAKLAEQQNKSAAPADTSEPGDTPAQDTPSSPK
jgi:DNA-binding beta-propeller fold protein YncE